MTDLRLRDLQAPGEEEAGARVEPVVTRAFAEREPVRRPRISATRLAIGIAALAFAAAAVTPPGQAVLRSLRDAVAPERGVENARPLLRLPAPGLLLVTSPDGAWTVGRDAKRRRLGEYDGASWSPHGFYAVVTGGRTIAALTPEGEVRWALPRRGAVADARWAPSGLRIAYRTGSALHLVDGNGTDDRIVARQVAPAAPAWRPGSADVVAFAATDGTVQALDAATGAILFRSRPGPMPRGLAWTADGAELLVLGASDLRRLRDGRPVSRIAFAGRETVALAAAPTGPRAAVVVYDPATDRSELLSVAGRSAQRVFAGEGRFDAVAWSPDGGWLVLAWSSADQWLFLRSTGVRGLVAVSNVADAFGGFPVPRDWCCAEG